jgi:hypothetical protein
VRDQYAGDVSDVIKFAFLRALAGDDRRLGIAWYYVPGDDGRPDGRHLEWRDEPAWRVFDEQLCFGLTQLPERSIAALEQARIWPRGTLFHREPVASQAGRSAWAASMCNALADAAIIFLDPDNGLGAESRKHATLAEVQGFCGRTVAFITFPKRQNHQVQVDKLHRAIIAASAESALTLRVSVAVPHAKGYAPGAAVGSTPKAAGGNNYQLHASLSATTIKSGSRSA